MNKSVLVAIPYKSTLHPALKKQMFSLALQMDSPGYELEFAFHENHPNPDLQLAPFEPHAMARNGLLEKYLKPHHELVMWIDADLVSYPKDIIGILDRANPGGITAPVVLIEGGGQFYDTYGYIESGKNVSHIPPYFINSGFLIPMDAVGCAYLAPAAIYHDGARYEPTPGNTEHFSIMQKARSRGIAIRCLTTMTIYHADLPRYGEGYHGH